MSPRGHENGTKCRGDEHEQHCQISPIQTCTRPFWQHCDLGTCRPFRLLPSEVCVALLARPDFTGINTYPKRVPTSHYAGHTALHYAADRGLVNVCLSMLTLIG